METTFDSSLRLVDKEEWAAINGELRHLRACSRVKEAAERVTSAEHRTEMYGRHAKEAEEWGAAMERERNQARAEVERLQTLLSTTQAAFCRNCPTLHGEYEELDAIVELREQIWDLVTDGYQRGAMMSEPIHVVIMARDVVERLRKEIEACSRD